MTESLTTNDDIAELGQWRNLILVGAAAPLIAIAFYVIEALLGIVGEPYPTAMVDWFDLMQRSKLLGLLYLNTLDVISITLLGTMYLAMYVILRRGHQSAMLVMIYLALVGIVVFIVPRIASVALLPISDQFAAATDIAQQRVYLTIGETLSVVVRATPEMPGFLIVAFAGLLVSWVILQGSIFSNAVGYVGIVAFVAAVANHAALAFAPDLAPMLMGLSGLLWFVWWLMISVRLFKLARAMKHADL